VKELTTNADSKEMESTKDKEKMEEFSQLVKTLNRDISQLRAEQKSAEQDKKIIGSLTEKNRVLETQTKMQAAQLKQANQELDGLRKQNDDRVALLAEKEKQTRKAEVINKQLEKRLMDPSQAGMHYHNCNKVFKDCL
jgi:chromosome segregation ATPase